MTTEEINTLHDFMEKYGVYWDIVKEVGDLNKRDFSQWDFISVIEEVGGLSITMYQPEWDETIVIDINTYDNSWEATYEHGGVR